VLAAGQRLRRRVDFTRAVRAGRRAGRGSLVVHLVMTDPVAGAVADDRSHDEGHEARVPAAERSSHAEQPVRAEQSVRAGFVVSKAVGGAVVRNRVRRRLRHLVRDRLDALPAGSTLVVRALPAAAERSYEQLGADLDAAIASAVRHRGRGTRPHADRPARATGGAR
jgi:ribonuclease P protein component